MEETIKQILAVEVGKSPVGAEIVIHKGTVHMSDMSQKSPLKTILSPMCAAVLVFDGESAIKVGSYFAYLVSTTTVLSSINFLPAVYSTPRKLSSVLCC